MHIDIPLYLLVKKLVRSARQNTVKAADCCEVYCSPIAGHFLSSTIALQIAAYYVVSR